MSKDIYDWQKEQINVPYVNDKGDLQEAFNVRQQAHDTPRKKTDLGQLILILCLCLICFCCSFPFIYELISVLIEIIK